jgi:hypothetical protein
MLARPGGKRFISASLTGHFLAASALVTTQILFSLVMLISGIG